LFAQLRDNSNPFIRGIIKIQQDHRRCPRPHQFQRGMTSSAVITDAAGFFQVALEHFGMGGSSSTTSTG